MKKRTSTTFIFLLAVGVMLFSGSTAVYGQVEKGTLWRDSVVTDLDVNFDGTDFHARWKFHRCHCGDLLVEVEQVAPEGVLTGELMMVDGQVLLSRGFQPQGEDIEPLIQAPSLMLQLAFELLNHSQPGGPHAVGKKQSWRKIEKKQDFRLSTGLATGSFAAPWQVRGSGWEAESGHRRFELVFSFDSTLPGQASQSSSMTFSGKLDFRKQGFPYPESTNLKGWRIQWLSLNEQQSSAVSADLTLRALRLRAKNQ